MRNITGNRGQLLKKHGYVEIDRSIGALFSKVGDISICINDINQASKLGGIYVLENGKILDDYSEESEHRSKYKIVPTGLYIKDTKYPIFASFLKFQNEQMWRGVYFGTGEQLFTMYKQHYFDPACFDNGYINIFCGSGVYTDIEGFGLKEVIANAEKQKQIKAESITKGASFSLREAIAKCLAEAESQDNSTKGKRTAKKAREKANMLQQRLEKVEAKEKKKQPSDMKEHVDINNEHMNTERKEEIENSINYEDNVLKEEKFETKGCKICCDNGSDCSAQSTTETTEQQLCGNMNATFVNKLYNRMLYKENWMTKGNRRLDFYIKNLINFLESERRKSGDRLTGNGYMYSRDKRKCILNLGIIDIYGNSIYIVDNTPYYDDFKAKDLALVDSKQDLITIGFTQEDVKQLPESFDLTKYHKDCIFNANIEDFDFLDITRLNHVIDERRDRFPDKFKEESSKILCDKLKEAVELAIKISKTDCRYVIPKWDFQRQKVQFMIPFHLDNELQDTPELAIIIGKNKDMWNVHTIITMDDAIADARILFRTTSWLRDTL